MTRIPGERQLDRVARTAMTRVTRAEARIEAATVERDAARAELSRLHLEAEVKLRRKVPFNAYLLDVLALIEVEWPADVWRWHGLRNNQGLPTVRVHTSRASNGTEYSLIRFLAIEFGVIDEGDVGMLYPSDGDPADVNPWHRTLRRTHVVVGNRWRYSG